MLDAVSAYASFEEGCVDDAAQGGFADGQAERALARQAVDDHLVLVIREMGRLLEVKLGNLVTLQVTGASRVAERLAGPTKTFAGQLGTLVTAARERGITVEELLPSSLRMLFPPDALQVNFPFSVN